MNRLTETIRNTDDANASASWPLLPHLFIVLECGRPLAGGAAIRLEGIDEVLLCRGAGAARALKFETSDGVRRLVLSIPDGRMSGRHARVVRRPEGFALEDLGSTNGTFNAGERVAAAIPLADGAVFDCGSTLFIFRTALPAASIVRDLMVEADALADRKLGIASLIPAYAASATRLARIAKSGAVPILILGESGTGKEVAARAVHTLSSRAGEFVPVNCGALPETLLESQLFGHVKGAFSGAARDEPGLVRASNGGTLFLDEIGDMPKPSQVALLRVLQEKEVTPVGATKPVGVDLRVVAATHRDVETLEAAGFRADLFARVSGYTHRLAPLRQRMEDLGTLIADLLPRVAEESASRLTLSLDLGRALLAHHWPLNVRELEQALRVTSLLASDLQMRLRHAPAALTSPSPSARSAEGRASAVPGSVESAARRASDLPATTLTEEDVKVRDALIASLQANAGNVSYVARDLGKARMQIHRWMKRFGLDPDSYRKG